MSMAAYGWISLQNYEFPIVMPESSHAPKLRIAKPKRVG